MQKDSSRQKKQVIFASQVAHYRRAQCPPIATPPHFSSDAMEILKKLELQLLFEKSSQVFSCSLSTASTRVMNDEMTQDLFFKIQNFEFPPSIRKGCSLGNLTATCAWFRVICFEAKPKEGLTMVDGSDLSDYEKVRLANIQKNADFLRSIGLGTQADICQGSQLLVVKPVRANNSVRKPRCPKKLINCTK